uniref:Protein FAM192A n=1 Tax=Zeugodacus cucurbitae TaxID=28588 RepID=A0A0A1WIZ5_ZEUCU
MSSGFVTESEAAEARKRRQEEWEKVRTPDQPLERPEEPYDGRSLFERLKEQKMKKDLEYEEAHKLKNLIRGLDDDEVQFLELVDQNKIDAEKKQIQEERKELQDFRDRVATLQEETADKVFTITHIF